MRAAWLVAMAWAGCSGGFEPSEGHRCITGPDRDGDGLCDADDACPDDPDNDADGDGLCAPEDRCPDDPDLPGVPDRDGDGIPDACDPCPDDVGADRDGDGLCDVDDPCPDTVGVACDEVITIGVQVDGFPKGAGWKLLDDAGTPVRGARGSFLEPGDGGFTEHSLGSGQTYCLVSSDPTGQNGGIRSIVFSATHNVRYAARGYYGWGGKQASDCFTIGGKSEPLEAVPTEAEWLDAGKLCRVHIQVSLGAQPAEVGWELTWSRGNKYPLIQVGFQDPAYVHAGAFGVIDRYERLFAGTYVLRLNDQYGVAWGGAGEPHRGATFSIWRTTPKQVDREQLFTGDLVDQGCVEGSRCSGEFVFDVPDCH